MAGAGLLFALAAAAGPHGTAIVLKPGPRVAGPVVKLGALAELGALPTGLRAKASEIEIARFRTGQAEMRLSLDLVGARARAALPALSAWLPARPPQTVVVRALALPEEPAAAPAGGRGCARMLVALPGGATPTRSDLEPADCGAVSPQPAFRYDGRRLVARSVRPLAPGEVVARIDPAALADMAAGAPLTLVARAGPVMVRREVVAAQAGRRDGAIFARTADGQALVVQPGELAQ